MVEMVEMDKDFNHFNRFEMVEMVEMDKDFNHFNHFSHFNHFIHFNSFCLCQETKVFDHFNQFNRFAMVEMDKILIPGLPGKPKVLKMVEAVEMVEMDKDFNHFNHFNRFEMVEMDKTFNHFNHFSHFNHFIHFNSFCLCPETKAPLPPAAPTLGNLAAMAAFAAKKDQGAGRGVNAYISTGSTTQSESSSNRGTRSSQGSETWNLVWNRPAQMRLPRLPKQAMVARCLEDAMKPEKDRAKDPPRDTKASRCVLPQIAPGRSLSACALGGGRPSSDRGRRLREGSADLSKQRVPVLTEDAWRD
eukprot:s222_g1.t1